MDRLLLSAVQLAGYMRTLVVLICILTGCGVAVGEPGSIDAPTDVSLAQEIWLPEAHPVYAAQQTWGLPLRSFVTVVLVPGTDAAEACHHEPLEGYEVGGCCDHRNSRIIIAAGRSTASQDQIKLHELGHLYRNGPGHPAAEGCPEGKGGQHVMCAGGRVESGPPDSVDYAFVLREPPYEHDPAEVIAQP